MKSNIPIVYNIKVSEEALSESIESEIQDDEFTMKGLFGF